MVKGQHNFQPGLRKGSIETGGDLQANNIISEGLDQALQIDKAARIWIEHVLSDAVMRIASEQTRNIVKNAFNLLDSDDVNVIRILFESAGANDRHDEESSKKDRRTEQIQQRIHDLEQFNKLNETLLAMLKRELDGL